MKPRWSPDLPMRALSRPAGPTSDFDLNPDFIPPDSTLRPAGVLIAFRATDGRLILTTRGSGLRHHPGQIALPGGKVDQGDADEIAAALREANEETGLNPSQVEVLGTLAPHRTVTGFAVTPVLALVHGEFTPVAEPGEVAEVFHLPFSHVADPTEYRIEGRLWRGMRRRFYVAPYGPYYLWGATARIMLQLAHRMAA